MFYINSKIPIKNFSPILGTLDIKTGYPSKKNFPDFHRESKPKKSIFRKNRFFYFSQKITKNDLFCKSGQKYLLVSKSYFINCIQSKDIQKKKFFQVAH